MFKRFSSGYAILFAIYLSTILYAWAVSRKPIYKFFEIWFSSSSILLVAPLFLMCGLLTGEMMRRRINRPSKSLYRFLRREKHWIGRAFVLILTMFPMATAYSAIKTSIPKVVPFYADVYFLKADLFLFGTDPWRITHSIFGYTPTFIIDRVYLLWLTVQLVVVISLYFTRNQALQLKGLISYQLSWMVLGGLMATALSSVGPCFYEDFYGSDHFAPLMSRLEAYDGLGALYFQNLLLDSRDKDVFGVGISAMPSLHVGIATLIVFLVKERWGSGRGLVLALTFFITTAIGSVHLGWHYAVDGLVSIVGVWIIWRLTSAFVDRVVAKEAARDRSVPSPSEPSPA